jgi:hypothetical protein
MWVNVKLDNVFVGGKPLTIRVSPSEVSAQKCAPKSVQVDPEWRLLEIGEVLRHGDEVWSCGFGPWFPVGTYMHGEARHKCNAPHRRRVRIESLGWRYLDAGETVQAGDEYSSSRWRWDIQQKSTGRAVSSSESYFFRRKTAPFAG